MNQVFLIFLCLVFLPRQMVSTFYSISWKLLIFEIIAVFHFKELLNELIFLLITFSLR